jgi:hypothetical protein
MKMRTSYSLPVLLVTMSLLLSACVIPGIGPVTPTATSTPAASATPKPKPTSTPKPTATHDLAATQQVEALGAKAKEYFDLGYISSAKGSYDKLEDYEDSWAQIGWYQWLPTGYSPTNFILTTDVAWKSASRTPDPSGCGFVFRLQDNDDHYLSFISVDGYVYAWSSVGNVTKSMGRGYYGSAKQAGSARLTLIMEDDEYRILVDDKLIKTITGFAGKLSTGDIGFTLVSGTNKDYGTNCEFTNIELWSIEQ